MQKADQKVVRKERDGVRGWRVSSIVVGCDGGGMEGGIFGGGFRGFGVEWGSEGEREIDRQRR